MNKLLSTALLATILSTSGFATGDIVIEDRSSLPLTAESGQTTGLVKQNIKIKEGGLLDIQADVQLGDATTAVVVDMQSGSKFQFNEVGSGEDKHYANVSNVNGTIKLGFPVLATVVAADTTKAGTATEPITVAFSSTNTASMLGKIDQNYDSAKSDGAGITGKIEVSGVDTLTYKAASTAGYTLDADSTAYSSLEDVTNDLIAAYVTGQTDSPNAKKLSKAEGSDTPASFTVKAASDSKYYSIPVDTIPTVYYKNGTDITLADSLASATDSGSVGRALSGMGISVKKDATNNPDISYEAGSSGTDAIVLLTGSDATAATLINVSDVTADIDKATGGDAINDSTSPLDGLKPVTIVASMHNIKSLASTTVESGAITDLGTVTSETNSITFTGGTSNYLKLTGNNKYLNGATFNCPVTYTSATAMAGGTYSKDLVIADDVTIDSNTTINASNLSIASGKTVTVKGGATLTLILEPVS